MGRPGRVCLRLDERKKALVERNRMLAVALAWRLRKQTPMPVEDLEQEASRALMEAAARWDEAKGVRFGTYAAYVIRLRLGRARAGWWPIVAPDRQVRKGGAGGLQVASLAHPVAAPEPEESRYAGELESLAGHMKRLRGVDRDVAWRCLAMGESAAEVARSMGLSRQRILQFKGRALSQLRRAYGVPRSAGRAAR